MKNKLFMLMLVLVIGVLAACGTKDSDSNAGSGSNIDSDNEGDKKVLIMGTSADYKPFEFVDSAKGEEIIGYDIDLARMIGEKIGFDVKIQDMDFNSLIPALQAGKIDFVISGMSPNEEREKVVDFSEPYNETKQVLVVKKESGIKTTADLVGKTVGVQTASIQEKMAQELVKTIDFKTESRTRVPEIVQDMLAKRLDAGIIENGVAEGYVKKNDKLTMVQIKEQVPDYKAIAVAEGSELKGQIDKALKELVKEGKIKELEAKWLQSVK